MGHSEKQIPLNHGQGPPPSSSCLLLPPHRHHASYSSPIFIPSPSSSSCSCVMLLMITQKQRTTPAAPARSFPMLCSHPTALASQKVGGAASDALQPLRPVSQPTTRRNSKLFLQHSLPSSGLGSCEHSSVQRHHLNAEIHSRCGGSLTLHAFAPRMKSDAILEVKPLSRHHLSVAITPCNNVFICALLVVAKNTSLLCNTLREHLHSITRCFRGIPAA